MTPTQRGDNIGVKIEQETNRPKRSPVYQRIYTYFLSEVLIFAYRQPHHLMNIKKKTRTVAEEGNITIP